MTAYDVKLEGRDVIAEHTMTFHFGKPAGFNFKPGQAIDLMLANSLSVGVDGARHTFSLVSAPHQDVLTVATRMRGSAFKRALNALPIGAAARFEGPFGSLTLHSSRVRPAVLIAGGIGITPFMSMLRQAARDRLPQRLLLLYSNHRPEDAAFLTELQELERNYAEFRLVATMTEKNRSVSPWAGRTGHIDGDLLNSLTSGMASPVHYVTGSPSFVASLRQALNRLGVTDDDIRSEEFFGY